MVKVSLCLSMADKQKTKTGLPLSGPDTDINVSSIHTVGYLGKLSENTSLSLQEYCPACTAKGEKKVLRRYCISLEESVLLCENPQCVFPLGCKPLNEILISPQPSYAAKNTFGSGSLVPLCKRSVKRQKTSNCNNKDTWDSFRDAPKEAAFQPIENSLNSIDNFVSCSKNGSNHKSVNSSETDGMVVPDKPILVVPDQLCGKRKEPPTESEHSGQTRLEVPNVEQLYLQWKNTSALCWLDCILTALVHVKVIRKVIPNLGTEMESPVKKLCTEYDQACALVSKCRSHRKGNGLWKIPHKTLAQMELILNNIRESLFQLLQPKLRCEMGVPDSPVFAFPHLLQQDPYVEALFMQSYIWSFECLKCGYKYDERCMKTLTTFTKIVSDWHPLNAVHKSPCNKCQDKDQRRKMLLDRVSSIYMLHFVDGLPHTDLDAYRFDFQSNSYRICTIIQYLQDVKHFVTWIQNSDGSWLECDDLKGSSSCRHSTLKVPAHEVHIVVWENTTRSSNILLPSDSSSAICISAPFFKSDATSFVSQLLCETSLNSPVQLSSVEKPMLSTFTEITAPNVNCVKENDEQGTSNSNLLSGLEHLADDAVVTLNLVEIKVDSEGNPIDNTQFIPSAQQCDFQGEQKNPFLQKSSLVTQMTVDHNVSVQPCTVIQYNNEKCQQMDQPTVVKPNMPQKYILPSDAPFCPPRASQLQATDTADVKSAVVQKDSTVKKLTSPASCPIQEIETASVGSDIPVQPNRKTQKKGCIKIPSSPILKTPTVNGSSADVSRPPAANRSFAVGWTRSLLNRHLSTLTSNEPRILSRNEVNAHKGGVLLKMTDPKHPIKEHFDGFKIKNLSKHAQKTAKNLPVTQNSNIPNIACIQNGNHLPRDSGNMKENCKVLLPKTVSSGVHTLNKAFLSNSSKYANPITCETGTSNIRNQSSVPVKKTEPHHIDSKAHNLRLKLLKKLQVKKDQLASLDQLMKTKQCGESATEYVGTCSSEAQLKLTNNGSMMYDDVLNELWRELGVEDKSVCTASSSASLSSSPSHHELLAELFTPATTTITSGCMQSNHLRLCGMSTDGVANCELSNGCIIGPRTANGDHTSPPISALQVQHHAYKNESVSVANAFASVFESPTKEEMLVDLLSTSTLNSLTGDHEDELPNFDENLFENC